MLDKRVIFLRKEWTKLTLNLSCANIPITVRYVFGEKIPSYHKTKSIETSRKYSKILQNNRFAGFSNVFLYKIIILTINQLNRKCNHCIYNKTPKYSGRNYIVILQKAGLTRQYLLRKISMN